MPKEKETRTKGLGRTENVTRNILWATINQFSTILLSLISRKIFLSILGAELLGANSLFADVFSLFSFADLGFGTAVVFSLYKPIAENDTDRIQSLLKYYRTIYRYVIIVLIAIGAAFIPFLPTLKTTIPLDQLTFYYILYQINCVIGYVCAYRETYIGACQQNRKISKFGILFTALQIILQIIVVKLTASYSLYVITALAVAVVRKIVVNLYIIKHFPESKVSQAAPLPKEERKSVFTSAKAVLVHRLGNLAINQTDSLIVSAFISVTEWGLMSNYLVLKTAVSRLMDSVYSSILPSMGNLVASEGESKQISVFRKYDLLNFWFYLFCYVALGNLSSAFIGLYFGKQYILNELTVFIFFTAFLFDGLRSPVSAMREANGTFRTDQWYTILAAVVNLVVSIILVQFMGLNGVYIGTCCAMAVLHITRTNKLLKNWKGYRPISYLLDILTHILLAVAVYGVVLFIRTRLIYQLDSEIIGFILTGFIALIIPNVIFILLYRKDERFGEIMVTIKSKINRRKQKE